MSQTVMFAIETRTRRLDAYLRPFRFVQCLPFSSRLDCEQQRPNENISQVDQQSPFR